MVSELRVIFMETGTGLVAVHPSRPNTVVSARETLGTSSSGSSSRRVSRTQHTRPDGQTKRGVRSSHRRRRRGAESDRTLTRAHPSARGTAVNSKQPPPPRRFEPRPPAQPPPNYELRDEVQQHGGGGGQTMHDWYLPYNFTCFVARGAQWQ